MPAALNPFTSAVRRSSYQEIYGWDLNCVEKKKKKKKKKKEKRKEIHCKVTCRTLQQQVE